MENFKELSLEEMHSIEGGGWITTFRRIVEVLAIGEAWDEFTDGFSEGYNGVEPWTQ